jgi:putative alpha-1,2-mannosidase
MLFPGPTMPFGMVKLSPDNQENVWNGGYEYTVGSISGFSHLHGMSLSGVNYMPVTGELFFGEEYTKLYPGEADGPFGHMWTAGYRSRYKKEDETGSPGYYSVHLLDYDIDVELTATKRCGIIRSTFPESEQSRFILNFDPPTEELNNTVNAQMEIINDSVIAGSITFSNQYADKTTVYFVSRFSKAFKSIHGWKFEPYTGDKKNYGTYWRRKCNISTNITKFNGKKNSGVVINFTTQHDESITVSTGISFVSIENAKRNMKKEVAPYNYNFNKVVQYTQEEFIEQSRNKRYA